MNFKGVLRGKRRALGLGEVGVIGSEIGNVWIGLMVSGDKILIFD